MKVTVTAEWDGKLLRDYLKTLHLSAKMLSRLKYTEDGIRADGVRVTVRHVLHTGEELELLWNDTEPSPKIIPADLPLAIAFENEDVVVPAKPADMPTHPSHDHYTDTVANALAHRYAEAGVPFTFRPVNRLDRNTSGLVLVARNQPAAARLCRSMHDGLIHKTYAAILCGVPEPPCGEIHAPLCRTAESIIVRRVCEPGEGDDALTRYKTLAVSDDGGYALVLASPVTGRTHQLRVHFAHIGHPILGDDLYGDPTAHGIFPRQALHAGKLVFPLPFGNEGDASPETVTVTAPLPADMTDFLNTHFTSFTASGKLNTLWDETV